MSDRVFNQSLEQMLEAVPAWQREELTSRVRQAVIEGWSRLGLWVGQEDPRDVSDLFGLSPAGRCQFVNMDTFPAPREEVKEEQS